MVTIEQKQSISGVRTYLPIEDYGIIGDLHTVALVGKNGSIDWYCVPAFDAPSVVAALRPVEARNLSRSNAVNLEEWETRSTREKFYENISRLTAALQ